MSDTRPHDQQHRDRFLARLRARLSYANITATLALFLALTGTATAAVVLPRDSVGAEQIQTDAGALARDPGGCRPRLGDPRRERRARRSLARRPRLARRSARTRRRRRDDLGSVSQCSNVLDCSNLWRSTSRPGAGSFRPSSPCSTISGTTAPPAPSSRATPTIVDEAPYLGDDLGDEERQASEQVKLMAVVTTAPGVDSTTVAVRCEEATLDDQMYWDSGKLTAIEVKGEAQED